MISVTTAQLYELLELPQDIQQTLFACAQQDLSWLTPQIKELYLNRVHFEEGLHAIQSHLGEDPDGMKLLWVLLEIACETWDGYAAMGIGKDIFAATMKFVPRFLQTHIEQQGTCRFTWSGWFWRQLAMQEYRVGCLEYELVEEADGSREISLHIPSDADLSADSIDASFSAFRAFLAQYYPQWLQEIWVCDSWMMSPALDHLLAPDSRILAFHNRFRMISCIEDSLGVLDWVFPPHKEVSPDLPERTSLQRKMKAWLLAGNKVGWTKAVLL